MTFKIYILNVVFITIIFIVFYSYYFPLQATLYLYFSPYVTNYNRNWAFFPHAKARATSATGFLLHGLFGSGICEEIVQSPIQSVALLPLSH